MTRHVMRFGAALTAVAGLPAVAAGLQVGVEIPKLEVAEYHRPYVAVWLERADKSVVTTLSVWYDAKMRDAEGTKWLKDMRQWWRRTGRDLSVPIDGVTQATRPVGKHSLSFAEGRNPLPRLAPGAYVLHVEASREVGGRELVSIPFEWPSKSAQPLSAQGKSELGQVTLSLQP